jgi:hypothetical protein
MGTIQFRNDPVFGDKRILFRAGKIAFDPDCCCLGEHAPCSDCIDSILPDQVQVTINGMVNGNGCFNCPTLDGTYILDREPEEELCGWLVVGTPPFICFGDGSFTLFGVRAQIGPDLLLTVTLSHRAITFSSYQTQFSKPQDCLTLNVVLPKFGQVELNRFCIGPPTVSFMAL